jgi:hypothetical protein
MSNDETDSLLAGSDKNGITIPSFKAFGSGSAFVVVHHWPLVAFKSIDFFATAWE